MSPTGVNPWPQLGCGGILTRGSAGLRLLCVPDPITGSPIFRPDHLPHRPPCYWGPPTPDTTRNFGAGCVTRTRSGLPRLFTKQLPSPLAKPANLERSVGLEPTASSLATRRSTTELRSQNGAGAETRTLLAGLEGRSPTYGPHPHTESWGRTNIQGFRVPWPTS